MSRLSGFELVRRGRTFNQNIALSDAGTAVLSDYESLTRVFGQPTSNLRRVSTEQALKVAIVYACTRLIAGAIAQLPLHIFRGTGGERERVRPEVEKILNVCPHTLFGGPTFWEWVVSNILLRGHVPTRMERNRNGKLRMLEPRLPEGIQIIRHRGRLILQHDG